MATKNKFDARGAIFIPAGLFLGMAYAFMTDNMPAGIFGGLGLGFLLFAIVSIFYKS